MEKIQYIIYRRRRKDYNTEATDGTFEISSVSIEENSGKTPVNYVLPPGFNRQTDPQNPQLQLLNEQSMVLRVMNLDDGDAKAAFKNVNFDMRQYRKLRMEVHAEAMIGQPLKDGDLTSIYKNRYRITKGILRI